MDDREILAYVELRARVLKRDLRSISDELANNGSDPGGSNHVGRLEGRIDELHRLARVIRSKSMLKHNSRMRRSEDLRKKARGARLAKLREAHATLGMPFRGKHDLEGD